MAARPITKTLRIQSAIVTNQPQLPMKPSLKCHRIISVLVLGLCGVTLSISCTTTNVDTKSKPEPKASQLSKDLIGVWVHIGQPGRVGPVPQSGGRFKFR